MCLHVVLSLYLNALLCSNLFGQKGSTLRTPGTMTITLMMTIRMMMMLVMTVVALAASQDVLLAMT